MKRADYQGPDAGHRRVAGVHAQRIATLIAVTINPADAERCGECKFDEDYDENLECPWREWRIIDDENGNSTGDYESWRGPECLARAQALREVVEAGAWLRGIIDASNASMKVGCDAAIIAWDRALAALEGLR